MLKYYGHGGWRSTGARQVLALKQCLDLWGSLHSAAGGVTAAHAATPERVRLEPCKGGWQHRLALQSSPAQGPGDVRGLLACATVATPLRLAN